MSKSPLSLRTPLSLSQVSKDVFTVLSGDTGEAQQAQSSDPRVILIFGWMDAQQRSLLKYMEMYKTLYPGASQILILSKQSASWTKKDDKLKALRPAVDVLKSIGFFESPSPDFLVHVFSNGGGFQLLLFSELLQGIPQAPDITSASAQCLILDSVPGGAGLGAALQAFTAPLHSFFLKALVIFPLTLLYAVIMGWSLLSGESDPFTSLRAGLNNPYILPRMDEKTPRVYIYSKEDQIVQSYAVEAHIARAKEKGLNVRVEQFAGSPHVAHAKIDPDRYWAIVRSMWSEALKVKASTT